MFLNKICTFVPDPKDYFAGDLVHLIKHTVMRILKGQCHEIFNTFLKRKKTLPGPHINRQKRFRKEIRKKRFSVSVGR